MIGYHRRMINKIVLQLFSSLIHNFLSWIFEVDWFVDRYRLPPIWYTKTEDFMPYISIFLT